MILCTTFVKSNLKWALKSKYRYGKTYKNNADYFSHDADMRNDVKIKALRRKFSHVGYAVWCYLLEVLTDSDFFEIEYNELNTELLSADFDISTNEFKEIIDYCIKIEFTIRKLYTIFC